MIKTNKAIYSQLSLVLMTFIIICLPLFKGGNYPGVMSVFILAVCAVLCLSFHSFSNEKTIYWVFVWVVFSAAVIIHAFFIPLILGNERLLLNGVAPSALKVISSQSLFGIRTIEVWSFFTVMWIFSWIVSISSVKHIQILLTVIFFVSIFQAIFGFVHFASGATSVLGLWEKEFYLSDATGTFVNRNHFSGMLAITSPLVLSALMSDRPSIFPSLSRMSRLLIVLLYSIALMLALITAHSRMGMAAALFGLSVCFYIMVKQQGRSEGSKIASAGKFVAFSLFLVLFGIWFGMVNHAKRTI